MYPVLWQFGKQFLESHNLACEFAALDNKRYREYHKQDATKLLHRKSLAKNKHAEKYSSYRLESTENCSRRRAYVTYSACGAGQRDHCGEEGERQQIAPLIPFGWSGNLLVHIRACCKNHCSEDEYVEYNLQCGQSLEAGGVYAHNINGISKRSHKH